MAVNRRRELFGVWQPELATQEFGGFAIVIEK